MESIEAIQTVVDNIGVEPLSSTLANFSSALDHIGQVSDPNTLEIIRQIYGLFEEIIYLLNN